MNSAADSHIADTTAGPIAERGRLMRREIQEQPVAWDRLLHEATGPVGRAATKTYAGQLLALWMLVQAVKGEQPP
jgi:hypothetical protein